MHINFTINSILFLNSSVKDTGNLIFTAFIRIIGSEGIPGRLKYLAALTSTTKNICTYPYFQSTVLLVSMFCGHMRKLNNTKFNTPEAS